MPKKNSNKFTGVFKIFFSSVKSYFLYLDQCAKYLAFPIFGQIISVILIFTLTYFYSINSNFIKNLNPFFEKDINSLIVFFIVLIPFFIILVKAIFDYIIAFTSLNLLFYTVSGKSKVKNIDFTANDNVIKRRLFDYIILMLLFSLICLFFIVLLPLIFVLPIILIFLSLCFQVFAFEGDISPINALKRSFKLVKGNVLPTIILILLCYAVTYSFLPNLFLWAFDKISLSSFVIGKFETFFDILPFKEYNSNLNIMIDTFSASLIQPPENILSPLDCAVGAYNLIITFIITGFTLPFRCCCFSELYKLYDSDKIKEISKESDEIINRAGRKKRKN